MWEKSERRKRTQETNQKAKLEVRQNLGKYIQQFNGKRVKVNLLNGEIFTGEMHTDFYNKYEYLLEVELGTVVIRKDAVAYIRLD